MKPIPKIRVFMGVTLVSIFISGMISTVSLVTSFIYRFIGTYPLPFFLHMTNSIVGLFFSYLFIAVVSSFFRRKQLMRQNGIFGPIVESLEKIAKGDFSVRLDNNLEKHENELFGTLINSVNKMASELGEMEKLRQEFISDVSHEIQSPLTSIRGFARALTDERLDSAQRAHYLAVIEEESTRLSRITDNLLRLASLDSDKMPFTPERYRLDEQIRSLILSSEPQWAGKKIEMDVSLSETVITADKDLLSQLWINLIHNAIKFSKEGGTIRTELASHGDRIEFTISDEGIGIPDQDLTRIFERFYKADKSRIRSREGSGLGLAIAKKIVEIHQGRISAESEIDKGSTFTVTLPAGQH
jgi:two-component system phosphate regulon sensor histidine kinase PhoR